MREKLSFWRSQSGFEVDFVIGDKVAIEVKSETSISKSSLKELRALKEEELIEKYFLICRETEPRMIDGIQIYCSRFEFPF